MGASRLQDDLLVTGDQPVVVLPIPRRGRQSIIYAVPPRGFLDTIEVRFPLDPRRLLLMTWRGDDDSSADGSFAQACNVNASVSLQADTEWFFKPGTVAHRLNPSTLHPDVHPISPALFGEYTADAALNSRRRLETEQLAARIHQEDPPHDRIPFVNTRPRAGQA